MAAAKQKGKTQISAVIRNGSLLEAQWFSFGVNKAHGLRRTNKDKRKAVEGALEHEQGSGRTNEVIAEHYGVNDDLVRRCRDVLKSGSRIGRVTRRVGKDGKTYDVSNTQKANKKRAKKTTTSTKTTTTQVVETPTEDGGVEAIADGLGRPVPEALAPAFRLLNTGFDAIRNKVIAARTLWYELQAEWEPHPWVSRTPSYTLPLPACLPYGTPAIDFRNREARAVESLVQVSLNAGAELQSSRASFRKNLQSSHTTSSASVRGSGAVL